MYLFNALIGFTLTLRTDISKKVENEYETILEGILTLSEDCSGEQQPMNLHCGKCDMDIFRL